MKEAAKGIINYFNPVSKDSLFYEKGQLNYEEFVLAGDGLTRSCLTWEWVGVDKKKANKHLPPEKQFLKTSKVRCMRRVKDISRQSTEKELENGWVAPDPEYEAIKSTTAAVDLDAEQEVKESKAEPPSDGKFVELGDSDEEEEEVAAPAETEKKIEIKEDHFEDVMEEGKIDPNERKYDIYITYYEYERVPRMWFEGYKGVDLVPLTYKEMLEDVMTDYAEKTVTYEPHPFLKRKMPSIHPCKHAHVMKKIIDTISANGGQIHVENALSVFLKFISSVVPTIESDFTADLDFGGDKAK